MPALLAALVLVSAGIIWAASRLATYADGVAERFQISRSWIGLLFVSIVTTLPEATVSLSALAQVGRPDLALSNNFGSILFNLTIIAFIDLGFRRGGILRATREKNALPVACAIVMLILVLGMLIFPLPLKLGPIRAGWGSLISIAVFGGLFVFMEKFEAREIILDAPAAPVRARASSRPLAGFLVSAVIVILCAMALAHLGDRLSEALSLRHSFVGFVILAVITSMPELAFGVGAVRIGAYDMLIGNIMGANMINALVIAAADLIFWREVLTVELIGREQVLVCLMALLASTLVLIGIINRRAAGARRLLGVTSRWLLLIYALCVLAMYFGIGAR